VRQGKFQFHNSDGAIIASLDDVNKTETTIERTKGLLGKKALTAGGLWIKPCNSVHTFGMKFPIDLIYLNKNNVIIKTVSALKVWRASGCFRAASILELPTGTIQQFNLQNGTQSRWIGYE